MGNQYLNTSQASKYLNVKSSTLACWRTNKTYPITYTKCGGKILYKQSDLDAWLSTREVRKEVVNA